MSYFIYTDLISRLLDPRLVDLGSTIQDTLIRLVHTGLKSFFH